MKTSTKWILSAVAIAVALLLGHAALKAHDAALLAANTVTEKQADIKTLQAQQMTVARTAAVNVAALRAKVASVQTVAAVVDEIPAVSSAQLQPEALPDAPTKVAVEAVPLYDDLNSCKQTEINLNACTTNFALQQKIDADKDAEVKALKSKGSFWARVKSTAITVGIGAAAGYVIANVAKR